MVAAGSGHGSDGRAAAGAGSSAAPTARRFAADRAAMSGPVQLPVDRSQDEARGFRALAADLLAFVLFQGPHEVGKELAHGCGPLE